MRRFTSGTVDQYIYFVAVDSTDLKTRETGLSSFTVYRARNGAAAAAYTTPTVAEVSSGNMPGVYSLLLDEDMTLASGNDSEEVVLHITQASMAPVTLVFEIYRPKVTEGDTLTTSSGGLNAALGTGVITAGSIAADAIGASELAADAATEIATAVWATAARTLTALDEDSTTIDLDATIQAANDARFDALDTAVATVDTVVDAIKAKTDSMTFTVTGVMDANITYVNAVEIEGDGAGTPWGP